MRASTFGKRLLALPLMAAAAALLAACSGAEPTPTDEPTPTTTLAYDPDHLMWAGTVSHMFADFRHIDQMVESGDPTFVPVLLDLWFSRATLSAEQLLGVTRALRLLTDGDPGGNLNDWFRWLSEHPEVKGPPEYALWKGVLYGLVDPNIEAFFYKDIKHRIRLEEIVWGGVRRDGIPDLIDPLHITPVEATYLNDSDRVFGVSINGEHRAYPLRVMNPHEMANDTLGGEPFALAY